jgi:hypothetical protein
MDRLPAPGYYWYEDNNEHHVMLVTASGNEQFAYFIGVELPTNVSQLPGKAICALQPPSVVEPA